MIRCIKWALIPAILLFTGCSMFTELTPKPPLDSKENGYIEIKKGKDFFDLKNKNKYVMKFPKPGAVNFYLVLDVRDKALLISALADTFSDGKIIPVPLPDETHQPDRLCVFRLDTTVRQYYWIIDSVLANHPLVASYRYVPVWRFKFEVQYAEMRRTFEANRQDSAQYRGLGRDFHFDKYPYAGAIDTLKNKTNTLSDVFAALEEIKKTFPENIVSSTDTAYLAYRDLRGLLETELRFQSAYLDVLEVFKTEYETRNDPRQFVKSIPVFLNFFAQKEKYESHVTEEVRRVLDKRLAEVTQYYLAYLRQKNDIQPIPLEIANVEALFLQSRGSVPEDFRAAADFVAQYNVHAESILDYPYRLDQIASEVKNSGTWPPDTFYPSVLAKVYAMKNTVPALDLGSFRSFQSHRCAIMLDEEFRRISATLTRMDSQYTRAGGLVRQINIIRTNSTYREIIRLLKKNRDLDFLIAQYPDVDGLSLEQQKTRIEAALRDSLWASAENQLEILYADQEFIDPVGMKKIRLATVTALESAFFASVENYSRLRATQFIETSKLLTDKIESLYNSDAFRIVHDIQFHTGSEKDFQRRKNALQESMRTLKTETFPATAIEALYKDFTANIQKQGVAKARAIAKHGYFYKGKERKILNLIAECDTRIAKWITKPATYRKFYVLPITDNVNDANTYLFRLNVQIESDAQFPVFDIHVQLPEEVAKDAGTRQWYEEITINQRPIKNEGRYSISAPTAANGYESKITPVQMNKGADNILEIRFKHQSYKVFEVSVMAQKPLIKKN